MNIRLILIYIPVRSAGGELTTNRHRLNDLHAGAAAQAVRAEVQGGKKRNRRKTGIAQAVRFR